jgi:predicted nucleic acid-binding protein
LICADTSAWVEFFRRTESPADLELTRLLGEGADLAMSEVVVMEVLAGARSNTDRERIRSYVVALPLLVLRGLDDYEEAATIYRTCRAAGETIRKLTDCLIAVPAIRAGAEMLHKDADFDVIARHTPLRIHPLP